MIGNLILIMEFIQRTLMIWLNVPLETVGIKRLSAAMTNTVYIISHSNYRPDTMDEPKKLLLRVYGNGVESILSRAEELNWFVKLSKARAGPRLLATFQNGRIEEYIESVTLTPRMMRSQGVSIEIAKSLSRFHALQVEGEDDLVLWKRIEVWRHEAKKALKMMMSNEELRATLMRIKSFGIFEDSAFFQETGKFNNFFTRLQEKQSPIVPCHNDLQHGNILLTDANKIVFIDYEYGGINYAAYDIANHFCEWASDFTDANSTPHIMDFEGKYPSLGEREGFLSVYLNTTDQVIISDWIELVEEFKEISHLLWAYWGIIQASTSSIDFDYLGYSLMRLESMRI